MTVRRLNRTAGLTVAIAALSLTLGVLGTLPCTSHAQAKDDKGQLQGKWTGLLVIRAGGELAPQPEGLTVHFQGKRVTLSVSEKSTTVPFKVDAAKSPTHFEMEVFSLVPGHNHVWGIYKIENDVLTLFVAPKDDRDVPGGGVRGRPTTFDDMFHYQGGVFLVLKREGAKLTPAQDRELRERVALVAAMTSSKNNLHMIANSFFDFHNNYERFPPPAILSKDGKPLLSWRVAILPHIGQKELYEQFKLNEAWDSPHNEKLLAKMPAIYAPPGVKTKEPYTTHYQMFVGPDAWPITPLPGKLFNADGLRLPNSFPNGTSNTILAVEAAEAVPWSKPADLPFDAKKPLPKLGGLFKNGFLVVMVDTGPLFLRATPEDVLRSLINRNSRVPGKEKE